MALLEYTLDGVIDKEKQAIERIRMFDPLSNGFGDDPYYVAYSGGKDSDVLRILFKLSGVKHDLYHNHTTADAPETVYYIRSIPDIHINYPEISMWNLIPYKRIPPTRRIRYCCEYLKENGGMNRFVSTGVRWAESYKRSNRGSLEISGKTIKSRIILNADNTEDRKTIEICPTKSKRILNPIIDWTEQDVWEFLDYYGCQSNPLYQSGFTRIGCIGCPMAGSQKQKWEFERYPQYMRMYIKAFDRMITARKESGMSCERWNSGEEVFRSWISKPDRQMEGQISIQI